MGILCARLGHRPGSTSGEGYFEVKLGAIDGMGTQHASLHTDCARCGQRYQIGKIHIPARDFTIRCPAPMPPVLTRFKLAMAALYPPPCEPVTGVPFVGVKEPTVVVPPPPPEERGVPHLPHWWPGRNALG